MLSLSQLILKSSLQDKVFGFDSTYVDLVLALQQPTQKGGNYRSFSRSRSALKKMIQGTVHLDINSGRWMYKQGNRKYAISIASEGIKKIAILDTLLGNRFLSPGSVIFIDEPESALHSKAISQLIEIIGVLVQQGIQFFIATHSYFVIKKLYLLALEKEMSLPVFNRAESNAWVQDDLKEGIPDNGIISESINLFEQELG